MKKVLPCEIEEIIYDIYNLLRNVKFLDDKRYRAIRLWGLLDHDTSDELMSQRDKILKEYKSNRKYISFIMVGSEQYGNHEVPVKIYCNREIIHTNFRKIYGEKLENIITFIKKTTNKKPILNMTDKFDVVKIEGNKLIMNPQVFKTKCLKKILTYRIDGSDVYIEKFKDEEK